MLNVIIKERTNGLEVKTIDTDTMYTTDNVREDEFYTSFAKGEDEFYNRELGY